MTPQHLLNDCQFCSVVTKANGEDLIGTANPCDAWLVLELPQPWIPDQLEHHPVLKPVVPLIQHLGQDVHLQPLLIAPDREYSVPEQARVMYFQRIDTKFTHYIKQEFLVPHDQRIALMTTLLTAPDRLSEFEPYRQNNQIRDILVCTHGNVDVACARFGYPIYKQLRDHYACSGVKAIESIRVWRCSHFGGHQFAPTLVDLPIGQYWGHLEPTVLDSLVHRTGSVADLRPFYRGWAGLSQFGQFVERELWMQHGWDWLNYAKSEQILAQDSEHEEWEADWTELRLEVRSINDSLKQVYEARVEVCGSVMTAWSSTDKHLSAVKQYHVSRCNRIV